MNIFDTFIADYPFELFASSGRLGASHSSSSTFKLHNTRSLNAAQTNLNINATNGNAFIQDKQFKISQAGVDLNIGMVWNSSDNAWRLSAQTSIDTSNTLGLMARVTDSYNYITITEADGRAIQYLKQNDKYICAEPDQHGCSIVSIADGYYVRFFSDTGIKETFNREGRLQSQTLPTGQVITYVYEKDQLSRIILPLGRQIVLEKSNLVLVEENGTSTLICKYEQDKSGSLKTSIPMPDGEFYVTQYLNQLTNNERRLTIISDDQTAHQLTMNIDGTINSFREGDEKDKDSRLWEFKQDKKLANLSVSVNKKDMMEMSVDTLGHISRFRVVGDLIETKFSCDKGGRVETIVDKSSNERKTTFDAITGLIASVRNSVDGVALEYSYNTDINSLLFGLRLTSSLRDGDQIATTRYVYNDKRQCVFEISPEGRVKHYIYDNEKSNPPFRLLESHQLPVFYINKDNSALEDLNKWFAKISDETLSRKIITCYGYDDLGRRNSTSIISDGKTLSKISKNLDKFGRETGVATLSTIKNKTYDGLDRTLNESEADEKSLLYKCAESKYQGNKVTTSKNNGLISEKTFNSCGQEAATSAHFGDKSRRESSYTIGGDGVLCSISRNDGSTLRYFFSKPGQVKYVLCSREGIIEHLYDECDQLIGKIKYDLSAESSLKNIEQISGLTSKCKRFLKTLSIKDNDGNIRFEITVKNILASNNEEKLVGTVVEHKYKLGCRIATIQRAAFLNEAQLNEIDYAMLSGWSPKNCDDRVTRRVHDLDGNLIREWVKVSSNPDTGFYKIYEYNALGLCTAEKIILDKFAFADDLDLSKARLLHTRHWFDGAGRKIATLDADNYLTVYEYNDKNQIAFKRVCAVPHPEISRDAVSIILPAKETVDKIYTYGYDDLGRESSVLESHSGLLITKEYQNNGLLVIETQTDTKTGDKRVTHKEYSPFGELIAEASARVADNKENWFKKIYHPVTGLLLQEIDQLQNKKLYFYGANRKPLFVIDPTGVVTKYQYDLLTGKPTQQYTYFNKIDSDVLNKLANDIQRTGFYDDVTMVNIWPQKHDKDRVKSNNYNSDGTVNLVTKENKGREFSFYNAFSENETLLQEVKKDQYLQSQFGHDLRGNLSSTMIDPEGLAIETTSKHDDALNRETETSTASGYTVLATYNGLREQILQDKDDNSRKKVLQQDAFMRASSESDWQGINPTKHEYNDQERMHTIVSPVGADRNTSEVKNAFSEVVKNIIAGNEFIQEREVDGQVRSILNPDKSSETSGFDLRGHKDKSTSLLGLESSYDNDATGNLKSRTDKLKNKELTTQYKPTSFGEMDSTTDATGLVKEHDVAKDCVTETEITDPAGLRLLKQRITNLVGHLIELSRGDKNNEKQYREIIELDLTGKEEGRLIDLGNNNFARIHSTNFDKSGNAIEVTNGKGDKTFYVYDKRGNNRYTMDPMGFVIEKIYDANNNCIQVIKYVNPLNPADINKLDLLVSDEMDEKIHYIHDADGLPRFEIHDKAVIEYRYNGAKKRVDTIQYAEEIDIKQYNLDDITKLLSAEQYVNNPLNRIHHVDYDVMGRIKLERDAEGSITEYGYDAAGNEVYRTLNKERDLFRVYDQFGNLRFKIDAEGYVKERQYNDAHVCTDKFSYSRKLSEVLSPQDIADLTTLLKMEGVTRDIEKILDKMNLTIKTIALEEKDVHLVRALDAAHRVKGNRDGEENWETYKVDGLSNIYEKTDKRGNVWQSKYNQANKLAHNISPKIDITQVSYDAKTEKLVASVPPLTTEVDCEYKYDAAFNKNETILAANIPEDKRAVTSSFDGNQKLIATTIANATVSLDKASITKDIITKNILDYAGRNLIEYAANGGRFFTVYDNRGRKRFTVDAEGYIVEFRYKYAFGEPDTVVHYANGMKKDDLTARDKPFTISEIQQFISSKPSKLNRTTQFTYNRRGQKKTAKKDKGYTVRAYVDDQGERFILTKEFERLMSFDYNAFGELIAERQARMDGSETKLQHFYDKNGNKIATITAHGYLITRRFGMSNCVKDADKYIELSSTQYFNPIPVDKRGSLDEILAAVKPDPINDRQITRKFDKRHLCIETSIADGHPFFNTYRDKDRLLKSREENSTVTTKIEYDSDGKPAILTDAYDNKSYLIYNAVGDVIWEIGFLVEVAENVFQRPVRQFLYNAHRQVIGTILYANPGNLKIEDGKIVLDELVKASDMDQRSLTMMCNRGLPIMTQDTEKGTKFTGFNEDRKPVRSERLITVPVPDESGKIQLKLISRQKDWKYNLRGDLLNEHKHDEFDELEDFDTYYEINAFGECTGEGPDAETFLIKHCFDNAGYKWFSNADRGIATVSFPNESDAETLHFRSATQDFHKYLVDNGYDLAKTELADADYEKAFIEFQRWVTYRNKDDQAIRQDTPSYHARPKQEPENYNVTFTVIKNPNAAGYILRFDCPDEVFLKMIFKLRLKDTETWQQIDISILTDAYGRQFCGIPLGDLPSDAYEFCLDFYHTNNKGELDRFPSYRADGEVMLDTGNYAASMQPIWYMENSTTLVIAGAAENIFGVELLQDDKPVIRIAGTRLADGKLRIDLAGVASNEYTFKYVFGTANLTEELKLGQAGVNSVNLYNPQWGFNSQSSISIVNGTFPMEIAPQLKCGTILPLKAVPDGSIRDPNIKYFDIKMENGERVRIYWGSQIPGAFINITDSSGTVRYQNEMIALAPWRFGCINDDKYNFPYAKLPHNQTMPLLVVNANKLDEIHALTVLNTNTISFLQLTEINQGNLIAINSECLRSLPANASFKLVSLVGQQTSQNIAKIFIGMDNDNYFSYEEIAITNFSIEAYSAGAYMKNYATKLVDEYFAYQWDCSAGDIYPLHIKHVGVDADIVNIKSMPKTGSGNRIYYQQVAGKNIFYPPGPVMISLFKDGDRIPFTYGAPPHFQSYNSPQERMDNYNVGSRGIWLEMRVQHLNTSTYDNCHVLYFKKLPKGTNSVTFEYVYTTSLGKKEWRSAECHISSNGGLSVFTNNIPAGHYECRILCKNGNNILNIPDPRVTQDQNGYCYMNINITKKEQQYGQVFSNDRRDIKLKVVKPFREMQPDAWNNLRSITDRKKKTINSDFNLFNTNISTTTPPVISTGADGSRSEKEALTNLQRRNKLNFMVEAVDEGGDSEKHLVNQMGLTLCSEDADQVQNSHEYDLFKRCTASKSSAYGVIRSSFSRKDGLLIEVRQYPNHSTEVITYNEDHHEIKIMSRVANKHNDNDATFIHRDDLNRARVTFHPLSHKPGTSNRATTKNDFHKRSGAQTREVNKDGREQAWSPPTPSDAISRIDNYIGNIAKHVDLAGQIIVYDLNFNKQIVTEVGTVDALVNKARGIADNTGLPPSARNLKYLFDEAGRQSDIVDKGAQITTRKRHDKEDYCKEYYFIGHDGHVYQATNTKYDDLHRIREICDTHIMIEFGYDKKHKRRYAKAFMLNEDRTMKTLYRESWFDYSPAGRVRFRDCVLEACKIKVKPGQGMEISYKNGLVTQQQSITKGGKQAKTIPSYGAGGIILGIHTETEGEQSKDETRQPDVGDRLLQRTVKGKDKTTVETFTLDIDDSILSQTTEITTKDEDGKEHLTTVVRNIVSKSVLRLEEEVITTIHDVIKGVNVIVKDIVVTEYTAADTITPGGVTTERISAVKEGHDPDNQVKVEDEAGKVKKVHIVARNNANGDVTGIGPDAPTDKDNFPDGYRHFEVNSEKCYLLKESSQGRNYYFYAEKRPGKTILLAYFGDIPDETESLIADYQPKVVNIDVNHQAFSANFPPPYPGVYVADGIKSFREIAEDINYSGYADAIAWANESDADSVPEAETKIRIPNILTEVPETAFNGSLPSIEILLGSMYPALAMPHITIRPPKVNWALLVAEVAVAAAVTYFTAGVLSGPVGGLISSHMGAAALSYGIAGMAGNVASQGVAMAAHQQQGLNVKSVAMQGAASAVSGGVLGVTETTNTASNAAQNSMLMDFAKNVATAEAIAAVQQGVFVATGLRSKPDWKAFGTAAFNGATGSFTKTAFGDGVIAGGVYAGATYAGDMLIRGQSIDANALSATVVGTMLGSYAGREGYEYYKAKYSASSPAKTGSNENTRRTPKVIKPTSSSRSTANNDWVADAYARNKSGFWSSSRSQTMASPAQASMPAPNAVPQFAQNGFWRTIGFINGVGDSFVGGVIGLVSFTSKTLWNAGVVAFDADYDGSSKAYLSDISLKRGLVNAGNGLIALYDQSQSMDPYMQGNAWGQFFTMGASIPLGGSAISGARGMLAQTRASFFARTADLEAFTGVATQIDFSIKNHISGLRLQEELRFNQANSIFTENGELTAEAIANSERIIEGEDLGNDSLVSVLKERGNISDWGKYKTVQLDSPTGKFEMHFYYNEVTREAYYEHDYKAILEPQWSLKLRPNFDSEPLKFSK